jgi:hypothetical protein
MTWLSRELVADALRELSSRELQERLWKSSGNDEVSSFTEAVEMLFDDSGLGEQLDSHTTGWGAEIESALASLDRSLRRVDARRPPQELIDDPAMEEVRDGAAKALRLLTQSGT